MKVEFLKGLGLEDEIIKQIQAESGKDVTNAKNSMQTQIDTLTQQVTDLQGQVTQRETDLNGLQEQLTQAGQSATKLSEVQKSFEALQGKYNQETQEYKKKLEEQQYMFSAKEAMGNIKFSCNAAKREFLDNLVKENLPVKDGELLGFDQFLAKQKESDPDAFIKEEKENKDTKPNFAPAPNSQVTEKQEEENPFGFNFIGVRPKT